MQSRPLLAAKPAARTFSVVLADDTHDLRELMRAWLEEAGHAVITASSGREIVDLFHRRRFDLLVTDILMPDGDGWDAIAQVQRRRPETRILAMSGGAREMPASAVLRAAHAAGALGVLHKPFCRPDFFAALSRVMRDGVR